MMTHPTSLFPSARFERMVEGLERSRQKGWKGRGTITTNYNNMMTMSERMWTGGQAYDSIQV